MSRRRPRPRAALARVINAFKAGTAYDDKRCLCMTDGRTIIVRRRPIAWRADDGTVYIVAYVGDSQGAQQDWVDVKTAFIDLDIEVCSVCGSEKACRCDAHFHYKCYFVEVESLDHADYERLESEAAELMTKALLVKKLAEERSLWERQKKVDNGNR